jgi:hypothetical protein
LAAVDAGFGATMGGKACLYAYLVMQIDENPQK